MTTPRTAAGPREWIGLAVLALPTLLLSLDFSVLYLALPELSADLGPSATQQLWIIDIYGFMIAGFLITMGTLGDRIGRRRLLMIGAAAFGLASILAAYANGPITLIAARAVLGVAGSTLMPSTLALISNMFGDPRQRATAIAVWMSSFLVGTAIGPVVGGALLASFWWGSAFLLGLPVMVLLLIAAPLLLPEYRDAEAGRLDVPSVVLSLCAILPIVFFLKEIAEGGDPLTLAALVLGLASGTLFVRRQRRLADPLLDLRLFRSRTFSAALGIMVLDAVTFGGIFLFATQYLQMVKGLPPFEAGLWLVPPALTMIVASLATPPLAQRIHPARLIGTGLLIAALGFALLAAVTPSGFAGAPLLVIALTLMYVGTAPVGALGTDIVVGTAPPEKAGSAASMSETGFELGVSLGVAVLGTAGTAYFRSRTGGDHDNLAAAVAAGGDALAPAYAAFTDGLNLVAALSAAIMTIMAILAFVLLRPLRPLGAAEPLENLTTGLPTASRVLPCKQSAQVTPCTPVDSG